MKMQNNNVKMIVNLGTDPTVKADRHGKKMARFSATMGERVDHEGADKKVKWYSVISWGAVADVAEKFLKKGKRVILHGHKVTYQWKDKNGNIRSKDEIVATNLVLLDSGRGTSSAQPEFPSAA